MATNLYDEDLPSGGANISVGDNNIRAMWLDIRERIGQGGHHIQNAASRTPGSGNENDDWKHAIGAEGTSPSYSETGIFTIYAADATLAAFRIHGTSHATNATEALLHANYKYMGTNVTSGASPGHTHTSKRTIMFFVPSTPIVGAQPIIIPFNDTGTITKIWLLANTAGSVEDPVEFTEVDVWKAAGAIPTVGNTIFSGGTKPKLADSVNIVSTTDITVTAVTAEDVFKINMDTVGANVNSLSLLIEIDSSTVD